MRIAVIGISYRNAPLAVRERVSFRNDDLAGHYGALKNYHEVRESFILSTCNRVELYGAGGDAAALCGGLKAFLCRSHGLPSDYLRDYVYMKTDIEARAHLLRVSSGLDSMVIGEPQIMGQIRKAYAFACSAGAIGSHLHKAIQEALRVGKKARSLTGISRGVTSISGVVVELVKKETGLGDKKALVIGAGKIGALTVAKLAALGMDEITVINRDRALAQELAMGHNARVADISALPQEILRADIVIAATAAPHIVGRGMLEEILRTRRRRLLLIDLGVPRNVDESARKMPMLRLYNIDDLAPFIEETMHSRNIEASKAERIIEDEIAMTEKKVDDYAMSGALCSG